jgi:serine/threonine protein kinase
MQISDIDGQYELIKKNIEESSRVNVQRDQRIQSQIQLLRGSIEILMNMGIDTSTFFTKAKSQDSAHTENDLKEMAEAVYSKINNEMNLLQKEGVVVTHPSDEIRALIDDKNYAKAIIASGKKMSGSSALRETYSKAVLLKNILEPSPVIALFNTGNYEQFLDEGDEIYDLVNQCTTLTAKAEPLGTIPENIPKKFLELSKEQLLNTISALKRFIQESEEIKRARLSARELFEKADTFGKIPDGILTNIDKLDKQQLERTITELEKYLKTAKPDLTFSIEKTQFVVNQWHKTKISITNKGNAHAHEINFIFSQEFDTKWIEETNVKAQGSSEIEIGLLPKTEGNIPLEITAKYHDGHNKEYTSRNKFWIEVIDKMSKTPAPGPAPIKPKPPTQKQLPPELSDRYTKSEFIGEGGFARVFKAMRNDGKYVAVKIPLSMDAKTGKSFIAEMQNWTKLSHPNIVKLYDYNILPMPYFEEEICDCSLADQDKPIESEEAALILFNICEGLKFAHVQKIIHRDLKPQNVLLKNGVLKISDWGLSRIISASTTTTATSFTPNYAAPEQINNRAKDERTDIWQLGVILYELVTGKLPFQGDSMTEIGMGIVTKDPMPPGEIKPEAKVIDAVVMKCLQKDPAKRYQSVLELQKDLAMYLRENYAELLKTSVSVKDNNRSAYYCGDLVMINLFTGDMKSAYKYLLDLVHYSKGDVKVESQKLAEQLKYLIDHGIDEISDEFIQKAEIIVHQVSLGFRKRG